MKSRSKKTFRSHTQTAQIGNLKIIMEDEMAADIWKSIKVSYFDYDRKNQIRVMRHTFQTFNEQKAKRLDKILARGNENGSNE